MVSKKKNWMHRKDIEGIPLFASHRVGSHSSYAQRRLCADGILKRNVKLNAIRIVQKTTTNNAKMHVRITKKSIVAL